MNKGSAAVASKLTVVGHKDDNDDSHSDDDDSDGDAKDSSFQKVGAGISEHIMISYQWANQKILIKIRDEMRKKGYNVWMDIDQMGGSTLAAMAEAVEKASVVLVCVSQKYKDSPNCRAGEYTFSNYYVHVNYIYSGLSLSRPRLSRITAYLEVKFLSLPKHENLPTSKEYC